MLDAMIRAAEDHGEHGVTFHASVGDSERRTYRDLDRAARADAVALRSQGTSPGDRVVLAHQPGLEFVRALYAVMYAGLTAVPVSLTGPEETVRENVKRIVRDCGARFILGDPAGLALVADGVTTARTLQWPEPHAADPQYWEHPETSPEDTALIQYTSGSTSSPKGVVVSHANLIANQHAVAEAAGHTSESVLVGWLPHFHDMGFGMYVQPIFAGFDLVATSPSQFLRRPAFWPQLVSMYRGTTTVGPDFAYRLCAQLATGSQIEGIDLSSLRAAITGAEPVRASTLKLFTERFSSFGFSAAAFTPAYGMAETTLLVAGYSEQSEPTILSVDPELLASGKVLEVVPGQGKQLVSCGRPASRHTIAIVDPASLAPCGESEVGEIWVSGPSVASGYFGKPEASLEVFVSSPDLGERQWVRTGDLGLVRAGELYVTGRIKDLIILRGRNLYPSDLENRARSLIQGKREMQAAAFEHDSDNVVLVVETDARQGFDLDELRSAIAQEFSIDRLTVVTVGRGTIPRTSSGKVKRNATRTALLAGDILALETAGPTLHGVVSAAPMEAHA